MDCLDFWAFFEPEGVNCGVILGISSKLSGFSKLFSSGWARLSKPLLVDGMEELATGFLGIEKGFLWFFLWLLTLVNPAKSGLSGEEEVEVFRFEG